MKTWISVLTVMATGLLFSDVALAQEAGSNLYQGFLGIGAGLAVGLGGLGGGIGMGIAVGNLYQSISLYHVDSHQLKTRQHLLERDLPLKGAVFVFNIYVAALTTTGILTSRPS